VGSVQAHGRCGVGSSVYMPWCMVHMGEFAMSAQLAVLSQPVMHTIPTCVTYVQPLAALLNTGCVHGGCSMSFND
jgi:hypothetical protein